jgi:hypothetical protein
MFDSGVIVLPADVLSALVDCEQTGGWLSGTVLESEQVFVVNSAQIGEGTVFTKNFPGLLSHVTYHLFRGKIKGELLEWRRPEPGFLSRRRGYTSVDTSELAAELFFGAEELSSGPREVCVVEAGEKGPKARAFVVRSKDGKSRLVPRETRVLPTDQEAYPRVPKELVTPLSLKRVAIVGVGSGGGDIALNLACAGVGRLDLFDGDRLWPENYVRHELTRRDLGRTKVAGLVDVIRDRNLPTVVEIAFGDVVFWADDFRGKLSENRPDLIVCATDSRDSRRFVNLCSVALNIPLVVAGILDAGRIGEVLLVRPRSSACYECVRLALGGGLEATDSGDRSLTPYAEGEGADLQSAVQRFDIGFVAALATRVALTVLDPAHYDVLRADYLVWGRERRSEYAPAFSFDEPLSLNLVPISMRADCPVCGSPAADLEGVDLDARFAEIIAAFDSVSA